MSVTGFELSAEHEMIVPAWASAVNDVEGVVKSHRADIATKTGDDYGYSYADLNSVLAECTRVCSMNGIAISQVPTYVASEYHPPMFALRTTLVHIESGQWVAFDPLVGSTPSSPQALGGAITYYRRYALVSLFGLQQFDNDAIGAERAMTDEAAVELELLNRVQVAFAALKNLDAAGKAEMKLLADGRGFGVEAMRSDVEWLSTVERAIERLTEPDALDEVAS